MMITGIIIVAGGSGTRMGGETPKQFLLLAGKPLLMHTITRFREALPAARLTVVLPQTYITHWAALCEEHAFEPELTVVAGGKNRFESVKNGLPSVSDCDYIGVHDGVRPLASVELIGRTLEQAQNFGAAIPVVELTDSLREVIFCNECQNLSEVIGSQPVDRNRLRAVQTPQFFRAQMLLTAYGQDFSPSFTDDASVVESAGYTVTLAEGDPANIKVTTPVDLAVAEALLKP